MERLDVEEGVLDVRGVVLEPLIDAAAGAGGFAKLTAGGLVLGLNASDGIGDERVMAGKTRERGRGWLAGGGAKDFMLALGDGAALLIHPRERVIASGSADIDHHAGIRLCTCVRGGLGRDGGEGFG